MAQRYVAPDLGGFGRLAEIKMQKRREDRLDRDAERRQRLADIQIKQAESNLAKIQEEQQIVQELGVLNQNLPEGENQFTATYKYLMERGRIDMAQDWTKAESKIIDSIMKKDRRAGADRYNTGLGKVTNSSIDPVLDKENLFEVTSGDKSAFYEWRASGMHKVDVPEGFTLGGNGEVYIPQETKEYLAKKFLSDGKKPYTGFGRQIGMANKVIIDYAAEIANKQGLSGTEVGFQQEDRKALQKSITQQEKQRGSMASFVLNMDKQIEHIKKIGKDIKLFDTRLYNKPTRWVRKNIAGSPELSKYEVYLGEIHSEIGKLSSGSTASIAELSASAREKWEKILDENLSIKDMQEVLVEVKQAGQLRMDSVDEALKETRVRLRQVGQRTQTKQPTKKKTTTFNKEAYLDKRGTELENLGFSEDEAYEMALEEANKMEGGE